MGQSDKNSVDINIINLINQMNADLSNKITQSEGRISNQIREAVGEANKKISKHEERLGRVEEYQTKIKNTLVVIGIAIGAIATLVGFIYK